MNVVKSVMGSSHASKPVVLEIRSCLECPWHRRKLIKGWDFFKRTQAYCSRDRRFIGDEEQTISRFLMSEDKFPVWCYFVAYRGIH